MLVGLFGVIRLIALFRYRIDSDEPQHLHVVWGWAHGLVQYRDVFDNHVPLFHLVLAPLFRLWGESPAVFAGMRLVLLPLGLASIALTYVIGSRLAGRRAGVWAAALASVCPPLVLKTIEVRNDTLWLPLVLGAIALLQARPTRRRACVIGLLAGLAMITSVKTVVIAIAVLLALLMERLERGGRVRREELLRAVVTASAVLLPLVTIALLFWSLGAFGDLVYGAFGYNGLVQVSALRRIGGLIALPAFVFLIWRAKGILDGRSRAFRFLALTIANFVVVLLCTWPVITTRDFLPVFPLFAVIVAADVCGRTTQSRIREPAILCGLSILGAVGTLLGGDLLRQPPRYPQAMVADVLRLAAPGDFVMDLKGESVFRRRPTKIMLEVVGRDLLRRGIVEDTIAADMKRTGTCVAARDSSAWPAGARAFLLEHFVEVGVVRVCGGRLPAVKAGQEVTFNIGIAARYGLLARNGAPAGLLDGVPYRQPRWLAAGPHTFRTSESLDDWTVLWANALP
jgi:hypothetical protein